MKTGEDITREAFNDFDHWQSLQCDWTLQMSIIQQASAYSNDTAYHNRASDAEYLWRDADTEQSQ